MENRRLLFAALLSVLVIVAWNYFFAPPPPPAEVTPSAVEATEGSPIAGDQSPAVGRDPGEGALAAPAEAPEATAPPAEIDFGADVVAAMAEETVVLEDETVRAELTNRGAQLISFQLKTHRDGEEEAALELIRSRGTDPQPFALVVDGQRSHRLNEALFTVERETVAGQPALRFRHRSELGAAEKVFSWTEEGFLAVEVTLPGEKNWSVLVGPGLRNLGEDEMDHRRNPRSVGYLRGEESETLEPDDHDGDVVLPAFGLQWVTLEDNFFLAAVVPRDGVGEVVVRPVLQRFETHPEKARFLPLSEEAGDDLSREQLLLVGADGDRMEMLTLFGDKRYSRLSKLPFGLEETVRWGFFGFLARPLYLALEWIHARVPNYGWSIVLLTCLVKLLFFPLTHKSQESMAKMQELNPKVQAIRAKYRSKLKDKSGRPNVDAQRQMNEEVMKLYKSSGVNPASGCFPLLLQAPVFFALFRLLLTAVELRGAPWLLWIQDLSAPDHLYILPILMGVTSIGMQKMMPSSPDPMQRRLMQFMPLMFMFFAFAFPSGLVLYWLTNNILTMLQQALLIKIKQRRQPQTEAA